MRRISIVLLLFIAFYSNASEKDQISLFTDRDVYASGETILVKVFIPETEQSGIVHIDLINTNGRIITGLSRKTDGHQADGYLVIPDSLNTGCYMIGASTRIHPSLTIREIFVCNRFTAIPESASVMRIADTPSATGKPADGVGIEGLNANYKTREKVRLSLRIPPQLISELDGNMMVNIAELIPGYNASTFIKNANPGKSTIIEKEGVVVEGFLKDPKEGTFVKNGVVFLSVPDSVPGLDYFITAEDGCFNFRLDHIYGKLPVVIQGFDTEKSRLIKIGLNMHNTLNSPIPALRNWPVPSGLQNYSGQVCDAATLSKIFNYEELTLLNPPAKKRNSYPFYGVPTEVVHPNLFIDLPDFTEVSRELLQGVKFRANNRIPTIQIFNSAALSYFNDPPLVLLDGIPVHDLNVIKNLGSVDIDRIEICRKERYFGDLKFSGVVAIYTAKRDLKRLQPSDDLIKLDLDAIQPDVRFNGRVSENTHIPDLRRVLLWNPTLKPAELIRADFETSDIKGSFRMTVIGKTRDGSVIYKDQIFEVN